MRNIITELNPEATMVNKIIDWGLENNRNIRFTRIAGGWCGFTAEINGDRFCRMNRWEAYIGQGKNSVVLERLGTEIIVRLELGVKQ
jgi:hypothetical protein